MRNKVACSDLEVGMYVVDLDRPWILAPFEPPFDIQGFTLRQVDEINKVQDLCRYVYIDPTLGRGAQRYLTDGQHLKDIASVFASLSSTSLPSKQYNDRTTLQEEVPYARQILVDTNELYLKIVNNLGHSTKAIEEDVKNVVSGLVESVIRNPEALSWLVGLKQKDTNTYIHAISVAVLALTLGRYLGLPKDRLNILGTATLLQDIGKMALPDDLLTKTERLALDDWDTLQEHVGHSVDMLENSKHYNIEIIHTVRLHHERYDGSGYPQKLSGNQIPLLSTISGIVDCYQAGTSPRPYREAKTSFEVLMELYSERDGAFPVGIIEQFIQCVGIFAIGSFVKLNTKEIGVVVRRNQVQQLKPKVMILIDRDGQQVENSETIDLAAQYLEQNQQPRLIAAVVDPKSYDLDPAEFFA